MLLKPKDKEGRIKLTPAQLRKLKEKWFLDGELCGRCGKPFKYYQELTIGHLNCRGMGGGNRDDSPENIQPEHWLCNYLAGSSHK